MKRQGFLRLVVATLLGAGVLLPGFGWAKESRPIKIGALFQLIGPEAEYGRHGSQGARMAEKEINERGGILGRKLEVLVAHEGIAMIGVQEARRYILEDQVDFLVGVDSSRVALAVSAEAKKHRKIILFTHAPVAQLTGTACHRYAFRVVNNAVMDARAAALVMKDKPAKRWYGIGPDSEYGRGSWEAFQTAIRKVKPDASFVGASWPNLFTADYSGAIDAAMQAEPDAVWSTLWGRDLVTFIRQAQSVGFFERVKFFLNPEGASLSVLAPLGNEMPGGLWVSARSWFLSPDGVENRVFVKAYRALYGEYPADVALSSYSAILLLKRVIEEVGAVDTDKIVEKLEGITYRDPEGIKTIRREDHQVMKDAVWGRTIKSSKYPFRILDDLVVVPGKKLVGSAEEAGCQMERE
ncbi:MAG: ABC transporter substrate-binding protein [Candidatus Methylomirabilales bacterium]